jgi:putative ABC transport system substrate-binding protein
MKRLDFITLLGGATAWPLAARAQQPDRVRRIGALITLARNDPLGQALIAAFDGSLRGFGWIDGRNAHLDVRWSGGEFDQMQTSAKELVALQPEVILAGSGAPALRVLLQETRTIPIVFTGVSDPVGLGFVDNLARPGGNVTGFSIYESSVGSKWVEMLKRIVPRVERIALVFNPQTSSTALYLGQIEGAAKSFGMELVKLPVRDPAELEAAITASGREPGSGLDTYLAIL